MNFTYVVGRPNLPNWPKFLERVEEIHSSGILTNNGPMVQQLEAAVCKELQVKHCVAVANATLGLYLTLKSMNFPPGSEVLVPSFTFIGTVHSIRQAGYTPVFVDIESDCGRMSSNLKGLISHNTKAIMVPNLFGLASLPNYFEHLGNIYGLKVIFDSAHSLGTTYRGKLLGSFGNAEVFSLHGTKLINGFEGGLITTNFDQTADAIRRMRNFGFNPDAGYQGEVISFGTNAKMSEVHAAMALTNFECKDELIAYNEVIFNLYRSLLPRGCQIMQPDVIGSNFAYVPVTFKEDKRDQVLAYLISQGTFARIYFHPCHKARPYLKFKIHLTLTESLSKRILCLPTGRSLCDSDVNVICKQIKRGLN